MSASLASAMPISLNQPPPTNQHPPSGGRASPTRRAKAYRLLQEHENWLLPAIGVPMAANLVTTQIRPFELYETEADWLNSITNDCFDKYDFLHVFKRSPYHQAQLDARPGGVEAREKWHRLKFEVGAGALNKVTHAFRPFALAARPLARAARAAEPAAQELERKLAVAERFE
ncbi:MAG: hypothetical protein M1826_001215 [Phylliscum demangeonii]|nr:MAG: hypothetical protein M1826_001215 [Phylliscum demangeonii]